VRRTLDPLRGRLLRQKPGQRFGHRLDQRGVRRVIHTVLREDAQSRPERGALGLVPHLAVRRLPRDERLGRFGEAEDATAELVPCPAQVLALDRGERRLLGLVVRIEPALLVTVPAPCGALDAGAVEDAQVRCEPLEVLGTWMLCRREMVCLGDRWAGRSGGDVAPLGA